MKKNEADMLAVLDLRSRRMGLKISQKVLANYVGVDVRTVRRWEKGEVSPSSINWEKLCEMLQIVSTSQAEADVKKALVHRVDYLLRTSKDLTLDDILKLAKQFPYRPNS